MKKTVLFLLFSVCVYSQDYTQKWNEYYKRYEYFDSQGNMTGYKTYNSYTNTWEYFSVKSQGAYNPTKSNINIELTQRALNSRQERYNANKQILQNVIDKSYSYMRTFASNDQIYEKVSSRFTNEYFNKINGNSYDLSSKSVTDSLINFLMKGCDKILKEELGENYYENYKD